MLICVQDINSRLAIGNITSHLVDVNFSLHFILIIPSVHLQVYNMSRDSLYKSSISMTILDMIIFHSLDLLLRCVRPER